MDQIHQCGLCNRKLKNAKSIERGYGTYCYKKVLAAKAKEEFEKNQVKLIDDEISMVADNGC